MRSEPYFVLSSVTRKYGLNNDGLECLLWVKSRYLPVQSSCPLWVKSRHLRCNRSCPLSPRKRHQMRHIADIMHDVTRRCHSITSSDRASNLSGMVSPSAFAVPRL